MDEPQNSLPPIQPVINSIPPVEPTSAPTPPLPPIAESQNSQPMLSKRNLIIFAVVVLALVAGSLYSRFYRKATGEAPTILQKVVKTNLDKYYVDSDSDVYPDFIEEELGFDPKVSAVDGCTKGNCGESALDTTKVAHNVLIILDASGSMQTGGRMDIAKQAIKNYIARASSNTNIGLMIYGFKGSNSTADKPVSCASAEVLSPIGQVSPTTIDGLLATVKPVGWTPMGYALQQATQAFAGKEGQKNEVILLSDGEETCATNPTGQAGTLQNSAVKVVINVIGFAVDQSAQVQLNQISTSGGGTFSVVNSLSELDQEFIDLYNNGIKLYEEAKCNLANTDEFRVCYNAEFNKVIDWITKRKLLLYEKTITQDEYDILDQLSTKIYANQKDVTSNMTSSTIDKIKQKQTDLNK
ncbi:MAG: VWA domain-containing protein [bacterium]